MAIAKMALADATRFYDAFRAFFLAGKRTDKKFPVPGLVPDEIAAFELEGKTYTLAQNDGVNHLHAGPVGFGLKMSPCSFSSWGTDRKLYWQTRRRDAPPRVLAIS